MLGKLIKYEWKATYKICLVLFLFMIIMTVFGCISFYTPMWASVFREEDIRRLTSMDILSIMSIFCYVIFIIGATTGIFIYIGVHFYKTMYSEEGYLTHTLPVKSYQILLSKILVNGFWYTLVVLLMLFSFGCLGYTVMNQLYYSVPGRDMDMISYLIQNSEKLELSIRQQFGTYYMESISMYILMLLTSAFGSIIILYGTLTLGQLSAKHKVMMSIVSYLVTMTMTQVITSISILPLTIVNNNKLIENSYLTYDSIFNMQIFIISIIINVLLGIVFYFISNYIISKKLNLE